jgi:hypothetical protein
VDDNASDELSIFPVYGPIYVFLGINLQVNVPFPAPWIVDGFISSE